MIKLLSTSALVGALAFTASAQHAQVSAVAVEPGNIDRVWVCNRDNDSVSVVDVATASVLFEIPVGVSPRSLAFSADGAQVLVANQRGTMALDDNWVTTGGWAGGGLRGSVSVIDVATHAVTSTLPGVGVEPYGVAYAPNGKYFAVSGFRSGTLKLFDAVALTELVSHEYLSNTALIPPSFTIADVDSNRDGVADLSDPRGFVIRSDSQRIYVTHHRSPFVSVLDVTLDGNGLPTAVALNTKIDTDTYPFDPVYNPVPVQTVASQGKPRFLEDVALSPDGTRALVPHVLHNVNHDVNHDFGGAIAGDFANRVYPALTVLDAVANTFDPGVDASARLEHEYADPAEPAEYAPFGPSRVTSAGNPIVLGGVGAPTLGGNATFVVDGILPGDTVTLLYGVRRINLPFGGAGTLLCAPRFSAPFIGDTATIPLPPGGEGLVACAQALVISPGGEQSLSNGVRFRLSANEHGTGNMGHRAGQPSRVLFNAAGDRALMLNRGSEDVFMYAVSGSDLTLVSVFPPRLEFEERAPLDTTTPMGDLPLGMALADDPGTVNDDARLYVINETTRTLSALRVDWATNSIQVLEDQVPTLLGADAWTLSERMGEELFEDASRVQTAGNFNNSCGSCHFEGGEDANVWQRPAGPRSTMPMYGGRLATGVVLWKGVRINAGETGPMFGGENGGHGIFSDAEQQALVDFHEKLAVPLNPNLDPSTGQLTVLAQLGKDLFFGSNDTGMNMSGRAAGCATCHPMEGPISEPGQRFFTRDFLPDALSSGENLEALNPTCSILQENILAGNLFNVNTGANVIVDQDGDMVPDADHNGDGYIDTETYAIMNADTDDPFLRDDPNSYMCPCDPMVDPFCDPLTSTHVFPRSQVKFSVPTKLGAFSTGPYFHDHVAFSLRNLVDPETVSSSAVYGSPAYGGTPMPGVNKLFNDVHDIRGHEQFVSPFSKVQATLLSTDVDADIEAILAFIQSL
jgi:YVTN family beta-propeller protein